jgi:hypothetical protein
LGSSKNAWAGSGDRACPGSLIRYPKILEPQPYQPGHNHCGHRYSPPTPTREDLLANRGKGGDGDREKGTGHRKQIPRRRKRAGFLRKPWFVFGDRLDSNRIEKNKTKIQMRGHNHRTLKPTNTNGAHGCWHYARGEKTEQALGHSVMVDDRNCQQQGG